MLRTLLLGAAFVPMMVASLCPARQAVVCSGGRIEKQPDGQEVFVIPVVTPRPSALERTWDPGPTSGARDSAEEMRPIKAGLVLPTANP